MKQLLMLLFISLQIFAFDLSINWNDQLEKSVVLTCDEGEESCKQICPQGKCEYKEPVCLNCIGVSNLATSYFFEYLGKMIVNSDRDVDLSELMETFESSDFITMNSQTIYNLFYKYNDIALRKKFRSLCPNGARLPLIVFDNQGVGIGTAKYVVCNQDIYTLSNTPELLISLD